MGRTRVTDASEGRQAQSIQSSDVVPQLQMKDLHLSFLRGNKLPERISPDSEQHRAHCLTFAERLGRCGFNLRRQPASASQCTPCQSAPRQLTEIEARRSAHNDECL